MKLFLASLANKILEQSISLFEKDPKNITIAYISTAADTYPDAEWIRKDIEVMNRLGLNFKKYDIKNKNFKTLVKDLSSYDGIFVTGGNTFYLLHESRLSGFDKAISQLVKAGKVYLGSSAGSCIMCPTIEHVTILDHPEVVPDMSDYTGLNLVDKLIVPHAGREKYRTRHDEIKSKWGNKVTFISDDQAVIVSDDKVSIVTS